MQFDWMSLTLELLNFLVLVWLLQHFFYQPVLAVLDGRRQSLLDQAAQAETATRHAQTLQADYQARLQDWQRESAQARQTLQLQLEQERARQLDALTAELAAERKKAQARAATASAQHQAQLARQAAQQAFHAAAAMLVRLADAALTGRIAIVAAQDLAALSGDARSVLRDAAASLGAGGTAQVACAHTLGAGVLATLSGALEQATGCKLRVTVIEQPALIAGICITIGDRLLQANLAEELAYFQGLAASAVSPAYA